MPYMHPRFQMDDTVSIAMHCEGTEGRNDGNRTMIQLVKLTFSAGNSDTQIDFSLLSIAGGLVAQSVEQWILCGD